MKKILNVLVSLIAIVLMVVIGAIGSLFIYTGFKQANEPFALVGAVVFAAASLLIVFISLKFLRNNLDDDLRSQGTIFGGFVPVGMRLTLLIIFLVMTGFAVLDIWRQ